MSSVQQTLIDTAAILRSRAAALREAADRLEGEADALYGGQEAGEGATVIRGRMIVDRLLEITQPGEESHYARLGERLRVAGYLCGGVQPDATLLAALSRSPEFESVRPRSGLFRRVDPDEEAGS